MIFMVLSQNRLWTWKRVFVEQWATQRGELSIETAESQESWKIFMTLEVLFEYCLLIIILEGLIYRDTWDF